MQGEYVTALVILSVGIAMFASYMGFQVATLAASTKNNLRRHFSLLSGSIALGGGVWSMHFIGMLAFELCTTVTYGWQLTLLSLFPAIAASWTALHYLTKENIRHHQLLLGAVLMGSGIGAMHYIGMAGMEMATLLRYDIDIFLLSIVVAVSLSYLSLWAKFKLKDSWGKHSSETKQNVVAGIVMGAAISGMHYTGMAAARFVMPPGFEESSQTGDISMYLALAISMITLSIIGIVLATTLILKYKDITTIATYNEKRLKATIDNSIDGIVTVNKAGIIISANASIEKILSWSEQELVGQNINVIMPEEHKMLHEAYIQRKLESNNIGTTGVGRELEVVNKQGRRIPVRIGIGHVELDDEHLFIGFISDLRQRIEMEQALRQNEGKFRSLISNIPGIAYRCENTAGLPMVFMSDAVELLTGYPASDFVMPNPKRSFTSLFYPEDLERITKDRTEGDTNTAIEYRIKDRDGQIKWMLEYCREVHCEDGNTTYLDGLIMDITNRKQMEEALVLAKNKAEAAAETRAAFMANMSHEIRTPMNAIIGFSDLLLEENLSKEQTSFMNTIHQSAQSLLHIINDVLDSAKLEKGELNLEYRNFALVDVIDSVISTFGLQAQKKGLELVLNYHPSIPEFVHGVPERIRQVLINLIGNAVKFTEKGKVEIEVKVGSEGRVQFNIRDEGIGMTQEQLEKVFDPFTQADASMSRKYGGTGLGTTISKQLVELMGGEISVTSKKGVGSCFTFELELVCAEREQSRSKSKDLGSELPPLQVLIADDVQQNLDLLSIILQRGGHSVSCVTDGKQALELLRSQEFDLAILDVQMPVLDGLSAASIRREFERTNKLEHIPIIALTASVLENDRIAARKAGMDGFANKPINQEALYQEIASVLKISTEISEKEQQTELQLINRSYALSLWGTSETLNNELNKLLKQEPKMQELSDIERVHDNRSSMLADLHKYKGIVGNLGLEELYWMLQQMEVALESNDVQNYQVQALNMLSSFNKIASLVNEDSVSTTEITENERANGISFVAMLAQLDELVNMLQHSKVDDSFVEELIENCPHQYLHVMNKIQLDIEDFEFQAAIGETHLLISQIKSECSNG